MAEPKILLGRFVSLSSMLEATAALRRLGFTRFEAYSPFPVRGLEAPRGSRSAGIGVLVFWFAVVGFVGSFFFQAWTASVAYPLVFSGKPFLAWPAFVPTSFTVMIFCGAVGAVVGMFRRAHLPKWHHVLFESAQFAAVTDDAFFVSVESRDPKFVEEEVSKMLQSAGAVDVEVVRVS